MGSGNSTSTSSASNNNTTETQQKYKKERTGNDTSNTHVDTKADFSLIPKPK